MQLLYALIGTIVIEGIVMFLMTRSKTWLYYNFLCNLLTNPLLNGCLLIVIYLTSSEKLYNITVAIGELIVLFSEAALYKLLTKESFKSCFIKSLITNGLSFGIGLFL